VGRTSLKFTTLDDAVARARAYEAAGADAIFVNSVRTRDQIAAFRAALTVPLIAGSGLADDMLDAVELGKAGVRIALYGHQTLHASVFAVQQALRQLRSHVPLAEIAPQGAVLVPQVQRKDRFGALERQ